MDELKDIDEMDEIFDEQLDKVNKLRTKDPKKKHLMNLQTKNKFDSGDYFMNAEIKSKVDLEVDNLKKQQKMTEESRVGDENSN